MRKMVLELDELDYDAVQMAITRRQCFRIMPEGQSNVAGAVLAEICRGWMEFIDLSKRKK